MKGPYLYDKTKAFKIWQLKSVKIRSFNCNKISLSYKVAQIIKIKSAGFKIYVEKVMRKMENKIGSLRFTLDVGGIINHVRIYTVYVFKICIQLKTFFKQKNKSFSYKMSLTVLKYVFLKQESSSFAGFFKRYGTRYGNSFCRLRSHLRLPQLLLKPVLNCMIICDDEDIMNNRKWYLCLWPYARVTPLRSLAFYRKF